jgi:hypothetical protein
VLAEAEQTENLTEQMVVHTNLWLRKHFRENNNNPVDYFRSAALRILNALLFSGNNRFLIVSACELYE